MFNRLEKRNQKYLMEMLRKLEKEFNADVFTYYGEISHDAAKDIKYIIEELSKDKGKHDAVCIFLTTKGGDVLAVQRMVEIFRYFYEEVNFIVPDCAYSAGTLWCMSADNIFMNYYSALGPVDPQVHTNSGNCVAALGYIDKFNEMIDKSKSNDLSDAELSILRGFDIARLREYEQSRNLAIDLITKWLSKYKFKHWLNHSDGTLVTDAEKTERAFYIANILSDNNYWKVHSYPIGIQTLRNVLKLKIIDYNEYENISRLINLYYECIIEYIRDHRYNVFYHTRKYI